MWAVWRHRQRWHQHQQWLITRLCMPGLLASVVLLSMLSVPTVKVCLQVPIDWTHGSDSMATRRAKASCISPLTASPEHWCSSVDPVEASLGPHHSAGLDLKAVFVVSTPSSKAVLWFGRLNMRCHLQGKRPRHCMLRPAPLRRRRRRLSQRLDARQLKG